jgi:hypothetical protein
MHRRHRFLIEISQNAHYHIGRVYLFGLLQRLLRDEVTFHSSVLTSSPPSGPDSLEHEAFTAMAKAK